MELPFRRDTCAGDRSAVRVSILVLMELPFRRFNTVGCTFQSLVSILVLMELPFRPRLWQKNI